MLNVDLDPLILKLPLVVAAILAGMRLWVTSVERQSQLAGTIVFLCGSAVAFVGLRLVAGSVVRREH